MYVLCIFIMYTVYKYTHIFIFYNVYYIKIYLTYKHKIFE